MENMDMIFKDAAVERELVWCNQSVNVAKTLSDYYGRGYTTCVFERALLPEICYQLIESGHDVRVYLNERGVAQTHVSCLFSGEGYKGTLQVSGPDDLEKMFAEKVSQYKKLFKEAQARKAAE